MIAMSYLQHPPQDMNMPRISPGHICSRAVICSTRSLRFADQTLLAEAA